MTQNWFATAALVLWPLFVMWLYHVRLVGRAIVLTILGAQLLLPVGAFIKLAPVIPNLDKISISNLAALTGCILLGRRPFRFWRGFGLTEVLLVIAVIS